MYLRGLVLFLFFLLGGARRSIRIDESRDDAQEDDTLVNRLEASAEALEVWIPGDLPARVSYRAGPRAGALRERSKQNGRGVEVLGPHRGAPLFRYGPRRAKVALQAASGPERNIQIGDKRPDANLDYGFPPKAISLIRQLLVPKKRFENILMVDDANLLQNLKRDYADMNKIVQNNLKSVDLALLKATVKEMEQETTRQDFWDDADSAQKHMEQLSFTKEMVARAEGWSSAIADVEGLFDLSDEFPEEGPDFLEECRTTLEDLRKELDAYETQRLLDGPYDKNGVTLIIQAGAGGDDATDWAAMLYRMYSRFAEKKGWSLRIASETPADHGYRSIELEITGPFAYGMLAGERGTHRLVRISPFNAQGKRQTSFASVVTIPILEEDRLKDFEIPQAELEVTTMRSGGAGGENVNKVETGVRMKHLPTGLQVKCTEERSQLANKQKALSRLKAMLVSQMQEQRVASLKEIQGDVVVADFGQQIRNYVFQPYRLVKDLRSNHETSQIEDVMDGGLEDFVNSYLRHRKAGA